MIHRCHNCDSKLGKVRSPRTDIEYCLQCGAALSGEHDERAAGEKTADKSDTRPEVEDMLRET